MKRYFCHHPDEMDEYDHGPYVLYEDALREQEKLRLEIEQLKKEKQELLVVVKRAVEEIGSEYCSHNGKCSADNNQCYAQPYLKIIEKVEK